MAWDPVAQKERWRNEFNPAGGVLSTAGNLIFVGDGGGKFQALDPATGKVLWEHQTMPGVATPVTYELDGKQYVAVMAGTSQRPRLQLRGGRSRTDREVKTWGLGLGSWVLGVES